jgi:hypothetical protein
MDPALFGIRVRPGERVFDDRFVARQTLIDVHGPLVAQAVEGPAVSLPARAATGQSQQEEEGYQSPSAIARWSRPTEQCWISTCRSPTAAAHGGRFCPPLRDRFGDLPAADSPLALHPGRRRRPLFVVVARSRGDSVALLSAPAWALRTVRAVSVGTTRATVARCAQPSAAADSCTGRPCQTAAPALQDSVKRGPVVAHVRIERGSSRPAARDRQHSCPVSLQ